MVSLFTFECEAETADKERQSNVASTGSKDTVDTLVAVTPENDAGVTTDEERQCKVENTGSKVSASQVKLKLKEELLG